MRLPFFRPKSAPGRGADRPERGVDDPGTLQAIRTQARRRLIGAGVLLLAAVVGFPLLFETQPRPLPGSVVIDGSGLVVRGEAVGRAANTDADAARPPITSTLPSPRTASVAEGTAGPVAAAGSAPALAAPPVLKAPAAAPAVTAAAESANAVKATAAPAAVASQAAAKTPAKAASAVSKTGPLQPTAAPASAAKAPVAKPPKAEAPPSATAAAASASAGASPGTSAGTPADGPAVRWVVQVGAYNDMERMRQARQKAEKLGFKTYITEVDTPTGKRTRVRLGPFATKKEAEAAAAKVKANGMAANVLSV